MNNQMKFDRCLSGDSLFINPCLTVIDTKVNKWPSEGKYCPRVGGSTTYVCHGHQNKDIFLKKFIYFRILRSLKLNQNGHLKETLEKKKTD